MRRAAPRLLALAGAAAAVTAAVAGVRAVVASVSAPVDLARVEYVQSRTCVRCHPDHYESWHRTFHRTMTQEAGPHSVVGDFDGASYTFGGVTSRFERDGERYVIETLDSQGAMARFDVALTVGSRRVQQYVAQIGDKRFRLPLAWNIEEGRWFHLAGGFLHPDGADFNNHTALWNANCIFCHNVKASPRYDWATREFDSEVEELGIACEACHAPGAEHIARNTNPLRRHLLYATERRDPTIVWPRGLSKEREAQVCGHCHGQRLPNPLERIDEFITSGDPYVAGADLGACTSPITIDSKLGDESFAPRFWRDGTPRLTAYEYQAMLMTPDYQKGDLRCSSCHSMHGGDPRGMITDEMRGPAACLQCHASIGADIAGHTRHSATSSGSDCYACHMPKITYGLLTVHPTHRIQNPDPSRAWRYEMPEACTLCHTNETARWAADSLAAMWPGARGDGAVGVAGDAAGPPPDAPEWRIAENVRALLAGDVVARAVAVMAFADARSYSDDPVARLWAAPLLLATMTDRYPAIRHFAYRALSQLVERAADAADAANAANAANAGGAGGAGGSTDEFAAHLGRFARIPHFDPLAGAEERESVLAEIRAWWARVDTRRIAHPGASVPLDESLALDEGLVQTLRAMQEAYAIDIGE